MSGQSFTSRCQEGTCDDSPGSIHFTDCARIRRGYAATEAQVRKGRPVATGVLAYFPDALLAVAEVSKAGNDQHNPGQPLHWAKEKSTDEPDALSRHLIDWLKGEKWVTVGDKKVRTAAQIAWRALALCQREIDAEMAK